MIPPASPRAYSALLERAHKAWDECMKPARLPSDNPSRIPYPECALNALWAWDDVMANGNRR